ncbi:MAG TPA: rRNA maturation RNase YbeY [Chitinophagaceae bacterium]|nr:rRNA maturation RNase YbeY [Chitinophagaceae bacterium]
MASRIKFFFDQPAYLPVRTAVKALLESVFRSERRPLQALVYVFTSDRKLLLLNKKFLKHDTYTDVITFDLSEGKAITGEIHISVERVRENAKKFGVPIRQEMLRVILHGALHLCGYEDRTAAGRKRIRQKEDFYLRRLEW